MLLRSFLVWGVFLSAARGFIILPPVLLQNYGRFGVTLSLADKDDYSNSETYEPFFEMHQLPIATTSSKLERFVECAEESGACDVTEMQQMIEELERLNLECQGAHSRECNLDTVAARNVLKVALASQVTMQGAVAQAVEKDTKEEECNPYLELQDECIDVMHPLPTKSANNLEHIVECAEGVQQCDLNEMLAMMDELERLNQECEGTLSRECNLQAVEARNLLKVALASQAAAGTAMMQPRMRKE